jgi:diguanylate cyclase (GGDEF)-like protein
LTLVDFGVVDAPALEQARRIVRDSSRVLGCNYAELSRGEAILVSCGDDGFQPDEPLGMRANEVDHVLTIGDAQDDDIANHAAVLRLSLRSVVFWPIQQGSFRVVLSLGWATRRDYGLTEEEMKVIEFLASLLSGLLLTAERQRALAERVDTDALTRLMNRSATMDALAHALSSCQRTGAKCAVLYVDIDGFKNVNDTHGHGVGDAALAEIGRRMGSVLRKHEVAGRLGGDEFVVIVNSYSTDAELEGLAMRLLRAFAAPIALKGCLVNTSASIGIATSPADAATANDLLSCADSAMYTAKRSRNSFAFYSERATGRALPHEAAAFDSQFVFCVQPIVDARTLRPIGGELLPRWLHPELGLVLPRTFLNAAVHFERLRDFERLMLSAAAKKVASFSGDHGPLQLYVNMWNADLSILDGTIVGPNVCLEFSEAIVARDPDRYVHFLAVCRERGYRVGLSGFGGDVPLRVLARLDLDFVKINAQQFRDGGGWDDRSVKTVKALVDQAHGMSCQVIAESVETAAEIQWLVANSVDALQGFRICSPLTDGDFSNWLRYRAAAS